MSGRAPITCHCEPVRLSGVAIPRLEEKCIDNCPTERGNVTISGGNRYLIPFNRGIATTSLRTGLAMTGNLEPVRQTPICCHAVKSDGRILFPKKHPGHFCPGCGGIMPLRAAFRPGASGPSRPTLATLSRLVRAEADTARLMRGKTTFLYWGFRGIHRVEDPKGKSRKAVVPQSEIPYLGRF